MKQEEKDLLLKDLFSRLPYNVKVQYKNNICSIDTYTEGNKFLLIDEKKNEYPSIKDKLFLGIEEFKQYLFPLSSMTEEQAKEMQEIIGNPDDACIFRKTRGLELWLNSIDTDPTIWLDTIFEVQDWLNRNHFDYRGLIEKGLAIDATSLNIY